MINPDAHVAASDAAWYLGISRQLLNYWRTTGKVEPVRHVGRRPLYRLADLVEVERAMRRSPQSHR